MKGPVESEIKLRVDGAEAARERLGRLPAVQILPRHFEDNVLLDRADISLRAAGQMLRVRRTERGAVLTYKGPASFVEGIRSRPEVETAATDADALLAIFDALGLRPGFRYQKFRQVYRWRSVEIVLDETPIGVFLEIEGSYDQIHAAAAALGYAKSDYIVDSYAALFFAAGGTGDMVFAASE